MNNDIKNKLCFILQWNLHSKVWGRQGSRQMLQFPFTRKVLTSTIGSRSLISTIVSTVKLMVRLQVRSRKCRSNVVCRLGSRVCPPDHAESVVYYDWFFACCHISLYQSQSAHDDVHRLLCSLFFLKMILTDLQEITAVLDGLWVVRCPLYFR
jgi:hypothetical protein